MSLEDFVAQAFKCGHDTLSISQILHTTEADIYNALAKRKLGKGEKNDTATLGANGAGHRQPDSRAG